MNTFDRLKKLFPSVSDDALAEAAKLLEPHDPLAVTNEHVGMLVEARDRDIDNWALGTLNDVTADTSCVTRIFLRNKERLQFKQARLLPCCQARPHDGSATPPEDWDYGRLYYRDGLAATIGKESSDRPINWTKVAAYHNSHDLRFMPGWKQ